MFLMKDRIHKKHFDNTIPVTQKRKSEVYLYTLDFILITSFFRQKLMVKI